jgi:signal transduction histidine kinase
MPAAAAAVNSTIPTVAANSTAPVHAVSHTSPAIATIYANGTVVGNVMPFVNAIVRPWQILALGAAAAAVIGFVLFILFYYRVGPLGRLLFRYHDPLAIVRWPNGTASVVKVRRYIPHLWEVADKGHPLDGPYND